MIKSLGDGWQNFLWMWGSKKCLDGRMAEWQNNFWGVVKKIGSIVANFWGWVECQEFFGWVVRIFWKLFDNLFYSSGVT